MQPEIDFEFDDLSPMIGGTEYGMGFAGRATLEWCNSERAYVVTAISLDALGKGKPVLNMSRGETDKEQWFAAFEHAVREMYSDEIDKAAREAA